MYHTLHADMGRPKTVAQHRERTGYYGSDSYHNTKYNSLRNPQKQASIPFQPQPNPLELKNQLIAQSLKPPCGFNSSPEPTHICIIIPKNNTYTDGFQLRLQGRQKKINPYSRENMQQMNKKSREMRFSQYCGNNLVGLYDMQNDRRMMPLPVHMRTISAMADYRGRNRDSAMSNYNSNNQIKPMVQSLKKFTPRNCETEAKTKRRSRQKQKNNGGNNVQQNQGDQALLRPKSSKRLLQRQQRRHQSVSQRQHQDLSSPKYSTNPRPQSPHYSKPMKAPNGNNRNLDIDIFMPQKQSQTGYVLHKFQSKLKKKCIEDNLHVMATLLKKKIKVLDKREMFTYLNRLMSRNREENSKSKEKSKDK